MNPVTVYMGYDSREVEAYEVAVDSLKRHARGPVIVHPLKLESLVDDGLYTRPYKRLDGKLWDEISQAYMSTEFSLTRFLVPLLQRSGVAFFVDCDVVFNDDICKLAAVLESQSKWSVACVKHEYTPSSMDKMCGQVQQPYGRKNWSSFMAFNCNRRLLTLDMVNKLSGRELHQFNWLADREIAGIEPKWNWLVGEQEKPEEYSMAHFTLGGPWFPEWKLAKHDDIWLSAKGAMK